MFTGYYGALSEYKRCLDGILRCPTCRRPARDIICHDGGRNIGNDEPIYVDAWGHSNLQEYLQEG